MSRVRLFLLVGFVGLALSVSCFRGPISMRILEAGLDRNLARDVIAELPDGLHVILCGAGGPLPDPARSAPCTAVIAGDRVLLFDAGSGAARNLARQAIQPPRVERVFLTHFHSDHIDGLGELATLRWAGAGRTAPLPLHGAAGVAEIANGLNAAYRLDVIYRVAHHGAETLPPSGSGLAARAFDEPEPGELAVVFEDGELRVTAFRVSHPPIKPAVGYRIDYRDRSVVISGDTNKSANLERFATGADLLVHEALSPELVGVIGDAAARAGNETMAKIAEDVLTYHATPRQAAESAEAAGVKHLLYYHVVPAMPVPGLSSVFLEGTDDAFGGGITLGQDGTTISLPAGSERVRVLQK